MAKEKTNLFKTPPSKTPPSKTVHPITDDFAFGRENYILMIAGIVLIVVGYMLMSGGKSTDPNIFNEKEIFSFRRITLAPIVVLIGYAVEVYAIIKKAA